MKIRIIFVLNFRNSYLIFFSCFPHPWIGPNPLVDFSFEIIHKIKRYIIVLKDLLYPSQ